MRKNVKKRSFMLGVLLVAYLLVGCNSDTNTANVVSTENVIEITESSPEKNLESSVIQETDSTGGTECPEGYVYDYQVSTEPIPEEIAALGGPCQGTIHAYPSKIAMALTELEMEKDPVLKAEVEKRILEVEAALEEEYGGEFVVDGVILDDELTWTFFCTEKETGYKFQLGYTNSQYGIENVSELVTNLIMMEDYYDEKISDKFNEDLLPKFMEVFVDGDVKIRCQYGTGVTDVFIAEYTDGNVDLKNEQIKLIKAWEILQDFNCDENYNLCLTIYPSEYQAIIKEKYSGTFRDDLESAMSDGKVIAMIENGDIWNSFTYVEVFDGENENNMDFYLQEYRNGTFDENEIWDYWIN